MTKMETSLFFHLIIIDYNHVGQNPSNLGNNEYFQNSNQDLHSLLSRVVNCWQICIELKGITAFLEIRINYFYSL